MKDTDNIILKEIQAYARKCLKDKKVNKYEDYISCRAHKQACQRFLDDVKRSKRKKGPFYWDEAEAERIVKWFHCLRHSKGDLAGQPIDLTAWEKFFVCQIYAWKMKDTGRRRFKKSFVEVGRKNAKSQLEAGISLYEISVVAKRNNEVSEAYTAGTKRDQSAIVFNEAKLMLKNSPLSVKFRIKTGCIECPATGGTIKPLSKEDGRSGDGTNPALLVLDEYHQHKTTEFYDLSMGSNSKEPLLMIITTAGTSLIVPCYTTEYAYCKKVLDPGVDVENDEYFVDILELDPEDYDDVTKLEDRRLWHKANPIRMTYKTGVEKIEGDYEIAKVQPEHMTSFLTKELNVWVQKRKDQYMDMQKWRDGVVEECPVSLEGAPAYWGFDISSKIDLTAVALVVPYQSDELDDVGEPVVKYWTFSHSFIPNEAAMKNRIAVDKVPYDEWEREGWLSVTDTDIVSQAAVMKYVIDYTAEHKLAIEAFCFDPANASKLQMDLDAMYGGTVRIEEVYQSTRSLNEATRGLRDQVYSGNVLHDRNPLMNYAMSNAIVKEHDGLMKIDKDATNKRIDPVDATLDAFKLARYHKFDKVDFNEYAEEFLAMLKGEK